MNTNTADTEIEDRYDVRLFEPGDRESYLDLYDTVLGTATDEWFAWKYEENPYVDHVPIYVAEHEGTIVGARPFLALRMSVGGRPCLALQPCDTMVHPDHRRQGVFSRMTERAIERYEHEYPFFFNFPNEQSLPGNLKFGWQIVTERAHLRRVENPAAFIGEDVRFRSLAERVLTPLARSYYAYRDARVSPSPGVSIRRERNPSSVDLAGLYRTSVPEAVHAVRDEEFYRWRFDNPSREYTTYIAETDAGPEASIVTGIRTGPGWKTAYVIDVVPLEGAPDRALRAVVSRILDDHSDADLFVAPEGLARAVFREFGFHSGETPPLSFFATRETQVVRALNPDRDCGVDITRPDSWLLSFVERDTT
jgi:GNAT superfamily N-acetyltransferase